MKNVMVIMKELRDTIQGMTSGDYKQRFIAEYEQTKIRYEKLKALNTKIEAHRRNVYTFEPKHDCPYDVLREQQAAMGQYLHILELRAAIENIELN